MSRKLPLVGNPRAKATADVRSTPGEVTADCVAVDGVVRVVVVEARAGAGGGAFASTLAALVEQAGRVVTVTRTDQVPEEAFVVLLGMDTPRAHRAVLAQAVWSTADVLLSAPSELVARALASAL